MSHDVYVKEVRTNGKVKYQAEVWFQGKFYVAKTFHLKPLAVKFKKTQLAKAIAGELLSKPMSWWAERYVDKHEGEHPYC